jgi:hypothetical protein
MLVHICSRIMPTISLARSIFCLSVSCTHPRGDTYCYEYVACVSQISCPARDNGQNACRKHTHTYIYLYIYTHIDRYRAPQEQAARVRIESSSDESLMNDIKRPSPFDRRGNGQDRQSASRGRNEANSDMVMFNNENILNSNASSPFVRRGSGHDIHPIKVNLVCAPCIEMDTHTHTHTHTLNVHAHPHPCIHLDSAFILSMKILHAVDIRKHTYIHRHKCIYIYTPICMNMYIRTHAYILFLPICSYTRLHIEYPIFSSYIRLHIHTPIS